MVDLIPSDIDYCKRKAMRNSEKDVSHSPKHVSFVSGLLKLPALLQAVDFSKYFSIQACFEGLELITQKLFGISLVSVEPEPGEVWADDVRKLEFVHETEGLLGILYCDLFARHGKNSHPSHYNIRSGKSKDNGAYQTPIMALV